MASGPPAPRAKRVNDDVERLLHENTDEPSAKKPRFDQRNPLVLTADASEEEEDSILDIDVIGNSRRGKRNAIKLDGYESDSEPETFDERANRIHRERQEADNLDEVDDIFADLPATDSKKGGDRPQDVKSKKKLRFLELDEIEGQEDTSKSGGHVSGRLIDRDDVEYESSESSDDDSDYSGRARLDSDMDEELGAGAKKHHAPRLEAFNMRAENEEGRFDENYNYVRRASDPDAAQDAWLQGITHRDIKRAAYAKKLKDAEAEEAEAKRAAVPTSVHLANIIKHLRKGETVREATRRLAPPPEPKMSWSERKRRKREAEAKAKALEDEDIWAAIKQKPEAPKPEVSQKEKDRAAALDAVLGSALQLHWYRNLPGYNDMYDTEREFFIRAYKRETGEDWVEPPIDPADDPQNQQWEFRYVETGAAHGPYTAAVLKAWIDEGQFEYIDVEYRRVGEGEEEWTRTADFLDGI